MMTKAEGDQTAPYGSCMIAVQIVIAQEQLGHASISTTLNIYAHVVDASHRTAVEAVEARLFVIWTQMDPNWRSCRKGVRP
jgi:hypothetical protein